MISFHNISDLVGRRIDEALVVDILFALNEKPLESSIIEGNYCLKKNGITFSVGPSKIIYSVSVFCRVPEPWKLVFGLLASFPGDLLLNVTPKDTPNTVRGRVGTKAKYRHYQCCPRLPRILSEDEEDRYIQDMITARKTGCVPQGLLLQDLEERAKSPYFWFYDVYEVGKFDVQFSFLISDQQLFEVTLSGRTQPSGIRVEEIMSLFGFGEDLDLHEFHTVHLPPEISSPQELFSILESSLSLPYFGNNWDSLEECLSDLGWLDRPALIVHQDLPLQNDKRAQEIYLKVLEFALSCWEEENRRLCVRFPASAREAIRSVFSIYPED